MKHKPANVRVAHVRITDDKGNISNNGGITIAAQVGDDHQVVKYAIARCHEKDNYNKQLGWNKAVGRCIGKESQVPGNPIEWRELVKLYREYAAVGTVFDGTV